MSDIIDKEITSTTVSSPVILTHNAAKKIKVLIEEEGDTSLKLRLFIKGGGCSGFEYEFMLDDNVNADDTVIEKAIEDEDRAGATQLLIDSVSLHYLIGAEIDYKEDLEGSQFIIRNPNAKTTCGCGSSFST